MNQDAEHLRLLSIFHYVVAGLAALFAFFPSIHLCMGIAMLTGAFENATGEGPPAFVGAIFVAVALVIMFLGWALATVIFIAGRRLAARTNYMFCLVVAAIGCIFMPFGTVLGVFTIIVLVRPSVKALFEAGASAPVGG